MNIQRGLNIIALASFFFSVPGQADESAETKAPSATPQESAETQKLSLPELFFEVEPRVIDSRSTPVDNSAPTNRFFVSQTFMIITCQKEDADRMTYCPFELDGKTEPSGYKLLNLNQTDQNKFYHNAVEIKYPNDPSVYMCVVMFGFPGMGLAGREYYYYDNEERIDRYSWITYCATKKELPIGIIGSRARFSNRIDSLDRFLDILAKPYQLVMLESYLEAIDK